MRGALILLILACASFARADELVSLRLTHEAPIERGRSAVLSLAVLPTGGARLLPDGPLVVELEGTALDLPRRTLRLRDAVDPRAETPRFELEVRAQRTGTPSLSAHVTAWICRGARCRPVETTAQLALPVTERRP
jgi:hypothetical protein